MTETPVADRDRDLIERVRSLCGQAASRLPAGSAAAVTRAAGTLGEPLRIAFAGRVSSGKSTLVNGYLGRRLAATDEGECTTVVTYVRFGPTDQAHAVLHDGGVVDLPLDPDGPLPAELGVDPARVASIEVELSLEVLRDTVIIDTPGLNSPHEDNVERTREAVGIDPASQAAAATADAILFVLNARAHDDEREVLRQFRGVSLGLQAAPSNAIGLLAKADEVTADDDPRPAAATLAAGQARLLGGEVATVLPVIGLLAQAAEAGFTDADASAIRALAALGAAARHEMLLGGDYFLDFDSPVSPDRRQRLYDMLRLFGLRQLLAAADAGASGPAMAAELRQCSGMAALRTEIDRRFRARRSALKAAKVLAAVRAIATGPDADYATRRWAAGAIDDLGHDPAMHPLAELRALSLVSSGAAEMPPDQRDEALRVLSDTDTARRLGMPAAAPDELLAAAGQGVSRWTAVANTAISPRAREAARIVARSLDLERDYLGGGQP
jgi:hypothetical protein